MLSSIESVRPSKRLDYRAASSYDGAVGANRSSKDALAAEAWGPLVRFFFDTVRHRQRVLVQEGLTPNDARAFMALDGIEGKSMRSLAEEWTCDASNATFIVDRLEERGLAERRSVPEDRRLKMVVLTPLGEETKRRVLTHFFEPPPELLELSREDLESLRDAVAKLPITDGWGERAEAVARATSAGGLDPVRHASA
jgi:DNA-binding MarR family transcriptional regulator